MATLGTRLRQLRKDKGIYQKDLAALLNITLRAYQLYESNDGYPSVPSLLALADYFNVSLDYLTGRTDCPDIVTKDKDGNLIVIEAMRPAGDK